jgi:GNAT superfamily N-acetyltransferase
LEVISVKGDIEILEAETASDITKFIKVPFAIYRDDPNWVPPLIADRQAYFDRVEHPFYRTAKVRFFLARRRGELVGRIATCINYIHNEYHMEKTGFFGFFDVVDDYEVAEVLLKVALITIKAEKMTQMIGPASFSTNYEVGMLVEGYDSPPVIMMTYNKPYYNNFVERFGLKKVKDLLAFRIDTASPIDPRLIRVAERVREKENIRLRTLRMKEFDEEVSLIHRIYNSAWSRNWGFIPMSDDEFRHMCKDLKQIVDPEMVFIAEVDGRPVGFSLALPNFNQVLTHAHGRLFPTGLLKILWYAKVKKVIDSVRIITLGIIPEYQKRGIDTLMYLETFTKGPTLGYMWGEMSWILEDNVAMVRASEHLGAGVYKKYRMYGMLL